MKFILFITWGDYARFAILLEFL